MGVHGLWDLLSPVGRRVSVETLAGKRLAIDASIWMVQFMKAMRDERGEMVRNAHILGFFRRICKLLFLRTKPVFVFDGATPALKRRTVIARRRHRENAQAKIRKTAEKLLLNHLKAMRLKELANDLENQRKSNVGKGKKVVVERDNVDKGKKVITEKDDVAETFGKSDYSDTKDYDQEALDAMLAASIEAEESGGFMGGASTSGGGALVEEEEGDEDDDDEEMLLPTLQGNVDPAVLASLPPSMQLDLLGQMRERLMAENRQKYQKVKKAPAEFSELQIEAYLKTVAFRREINEVQKAAGGRGVAGVQTSRIASEANREFIFSSSYTGNRQSIASAGVDASSNAQSQIAARTPFVGSINGVASTSALSSAFKSFLSERKKGFHKDIET
ncbi:DNA repair protein UVH3 [Tanacetum coccineum]